MRTWLDKFDQLFPVRYAAWLACAVAFLVAVFAWVVVGYGVLMMALFGALTLLGWRDTRQTRHSVLRNYPVIGHVRFLLEFIRPEIRQYFIETDNEAAPFSRQQRSLVYQRAKGDSDKRPFGTQLDVHARRLRVDQPFAGADRADRATTSASRSAPGRAAAVSAQRVQHLGDELRLAVSANAILALNGGAKRGNFAHDTGEGSISAHHREHGGDLIWEIGSGYFGCRNDDGTFQRRGLPRQRGDAAGEDDRAQAEPGRQAGPRRRAARAEGDAGDRRGARRAGRRRLHLARRRTAPSPRRWR